MSDTTGNSERFAFVTATGVRFYSFPDTGEFLGVTKWEGRDVLLSVPMLLDGTPEIAPDTGEHNVCEVENAEGLDIDEVNRILGTSFTDNQFFGR